MTETVPLSVVVMIMTTIISAAAGVYAILLRTTISTYERATEKRFVDLERATSDGEKQARENLSRLVEKNHEIEKNCIALQGEVNLLTTNHDHSTNDIESIKDHMVTKAEWEPRMASMERTLEKILTEIRTPGRYSGSSSSSRYGATPHEDPSKGRPGT